MQKAFSAFLGFGVLNFLTLKMYIRKHTAFLCVGIFAKVHICGRKRPLANLRSSGKAYMTILQTQRPKVTIKDGLKFKI